MLTALKDERRRSFAIHHSVAIGVKRSAGGSRIVVATREQGLRRER